MALSPRKCACCKRDGLALPKDITPFFNYIGKALIAGEKKLKCNAF
jgi:hypothetical protein